MDIRTVIGRSNLNKERIKKRPTIAVDGGGLEPEVDICAPIDIKPGLDEFVCVK